MVAEGIVVGRSLRCDSVLAVGRANSDRLTVSLPVRCAHCEPGWAMGASVVLRWRVSEVECELQMTGTVGKVSVRQHGEIVRSAVVDSASAAYEWAREQTDILEGEQRRTG